MSESLTSAPAEPQTQPVVQHPTEDQLQKDKDKEKKKKQILSPFQLEFPDLFRSDFSIYPSYTNLKIPYDVECRLRVARTVREYERRFKKEVKSIALQQACAWDGVRVARIFTNGIRIPRYVDPLSPKDRRRINVLMKERMVALT